MITYEVNCYRDEFGELSHREEHSTKKAAISAAKKHANDYPYVEVTELEKSPYTGDLVEGYVIATFRQ